MRKRKQRGNLPPTPFREIGRNEEWVLLDRLGRGSRYLYLKLVRLPPAVRAKSNYWLVWVVDAEAIMARGRDEALLRAAHPDLYVWVRGTVRGYMHELV